MFHKHADQEKIADVLTVAAQAVLNGEFDSNLYPHQHLAVEASASFGPRHLIPTVLAAVEALGKVGWELVTLCQVADTTLCAVMRRRSQ